MNNVTGLISGVPKTAGTYTITISAISNAGTSSAILTLTIIVSQTGNCSFVNEILSCVGSPSGTALAIGNGSIVVPQQHETERPLMITINMKNLLPLPLR